jgi:hypothetical protein
MLLRREIWQKHAFELDSLTFVGGCQKLQRVERAPLRRTRAAVATSDAGLRRDYFTAIVGFASNFKTPRTNENVG